MNESAAAPRSGLPLPDAGEASAIAYTIGTLVTDEAQFARMRASLEAGGFGAADCEYLAIDNTGNSQTSAYAGLNQLLNAARGTRVILCHQDIRLIKDGRAKLDARLAELEARDPTWAVAGNAGGVAPGRLALRISDPHGPDRTIGDLPERTTSLDENFLVIKRGSRIGFSRDLGGFHLYGADICMAADVMGYSAYVIDFHLEHLSAGNKLSAGFAEAERAFHAKWSRALRPRLIQTTCTLVALSGGMIGKQLGRLAGAVIGRLARRLPSARGWTVAPRDRA
jgi:hypothetical protein